MVDEIKTIYDCAGRKDCAGRNDRICRDASVIADKCSKVGGAGLDQLALMFETNGRLREFVPVVRDYGTGLVPSPVLILQGLRDLQVGRGDAEALHRSGHNAHLLLLRDTNHVLKTVKSDDRSANIGAYLDPGLPLAPGVVEAIVRSVQQASNG